MEYIKDITEFVFLENTLQIVDVILIPGSSFPELAEKAAELWKKGYANWVLPSGKYGINKPEFSRPYSKGDLYNGNYKTEWEFLRDVLLKRNVPDTSILKEDNARNTYENAIYSRQVLKKAGIQMNSAIICCQAFHARRCSMYYETMFPNTEFIICPVETQLINRNNWFLSEQGIELVMGEIQRYGIQFMDIIKRWMYCNTLNQEINPISVEVHDSLYNENLMADFYRQSPKKQNDSIGWINQAESFVEKERRIKELLENLKVNK